MIEELEPNVSLKEFKRLRGIGTKEESTRRHEIALVDEVKENPEILRILRRKW